MAFSPDIRRIGRCSLRGLEIAVPRGFARQSSRLVSPERDKADAAAGRVSVVGKAGGQFLSVRRAGVHARLNTRGEKVHERCANGVLVALDGEGVVANYYK